MGNRHPSNGDSVRPQLVQLSEEIIRWGFEILLHSRDDWEIAFSNPTAGPWKRVMATSPANERGEVYRFAVNERRPDLVLVSDKHKRVVIVEAKTRFNQLATDNQVSKTAAMYVALRERLRSLKYNDYWEHRCDYQYHLGLLWGPTTPDVNALNNLLRRYFKAINDTQSPIMCIAADYVKDELSYTFYQNEVRPAPAWFTF